MAKKLTTEQHQMLEDLTGKQYTKLGIPRKTYRHNWETRKLGLSNSSTRSEDRKEAILLSMREKGFTSEQASQHLKSLGYTVLQRMMLLVGWDLKRNQSK